MEVFKGVYAYVWGSAFSDCSNAYIIEGDSTIIVDPGSYKSYTNLFGLMRNDGIREVDYVFATHLHKDHIESAPMFLRKGALISYSEKERRSHHFNIKPDFEMPRVVDFGIRIEVLETPGHTEGSLTFYIPEYSAAITGDLFFENGIPGRWDLAGGSRESLIRSLEKVLELELEFVLPGHGRIFSGRKGIEALIEKAIHIASKY